MEKIVLNKKEYHNNGLFTEVFIEEYCKLKIYPLVGILEREAGLLSDLAEDIRKEGIRSNCFIYGDSSNEIVQFFNDTLQNFSKQVISKDITYKFIDTNIVFLWNSNADLIENMSNIDVLLSDSMEHYKTFFKYSIKLSNSSKVLYINDNLIYSIFKNKFGYYFDSNDNFNYNNLICYTMIVKDGGPLLKQVLTENLDVIDRWCILDTGSTDGTQDIIREVLKNKKGVLYEEPFINFRDSRNRCLDLAGKTCKYLLMLDDTYVIYPTTHFREFFNTIRGDQFADSYSIAINSNDSEYYSNRITKSANNLRYIHTIHEIISPKDNVLVTIPNTKVVIKDYRSDYMETRTQNRKQYDLQLLFEEYSQYPNDPRSLYYIAQTYSCIGDSVNKAKYFELRIKHPVQGYIQEKIDAIFELARTYNFSISPITQKEYYSNEVYSTGIIKITDVEWEICEKLYLDAWALDKTRPDSLYFIGIHYYLENKFEIAHAYLKKGFDIGYPVNSQYSLKPTLSFTFLPRYLTETAYYLKEYSIGLDAAELFLNSSLNSPSTTDYYTVKHFRDIHMNMKYYESIPVNKPNKFDKPVLCIVTSGGWDKWTGKDILTKGMGGSETWIIEMARYIKKNNDFYVIVFCTTDESVNFENVGYNPIGSFHSFAANNIIDYCIISRYPEFIPVAIEAGIKNIGIIFHDLLENNTILPDHENLRWIFGLTDWHCDHILNTFPKFKSKIKKINYGVNSIKVTEKKKNSFIYSSFPNRGLLPLLQMWKRIRGSYSDAELHIYSNLDHKWVNEYFPDQVKQIRELLLLLDNHGIHYHSWVSKDVLAKAWSTAEYFFYPCIYPETFCLTAMEAAISKTFVISNNLAGLNETIGNRGLILHGDPLTKEWQDEMLSKLFEYMDSKKDAKILKQKNYKWAESRSWETQAKRFMEIILE
jgi:hypothetical protein